MAGGQESSRVRRPGVSVEVSGEKPACIVRQHGINADGVPSSQMPLDYLVTHGKKGLIGADTALDTRFPADSRPPFIRAGRRVAGPACACAFPALCEDILASPEQGAEQGDFLARLGLIRYRAVRNGSALRSGSGFQQSLEAGLEFLSLVRDFSKAPANTIRLIMPGF